MKLQSISRKSVLISWFFSYVSVLLISVIISIIVYFLTYAVIEQEIKTTNTALLKQVQHSFDEKLSDVEKLCLQVNYNTRVQELSSNANTQLNSHIRYKMYETLQDFKAYISSMNNIEDFFVYFHKLDMVISSDTVCNSKIFFSSNYDTGDITYNEWRDMIQKKYYKSYMTINRKSSSSDKKKLISFAQSLPMKIDDKYVATIFITLDEHHFIESIKNIEWINKGFMFILSSNNEVLVSTNEMAVQPQIEYNNLNKQGEVISDHYNNEEVVISYISSKVTDLKYVSVIPSIVFKQKGQYVQRITIFSVFLCLILGGIISYYFVKRNYIPVNELVQILRNKLGISKDKMYNEYKFISEAISSTINEKVKSDKCVKQQKKSLRSNLLAKLLKGQSREYQNIYETLSRLDIEFCSDNFAVMQFYIENYEEMLDDGDPEEDLNLVKFIITNVVGELIEEKHGCFFTEVNDFLFCIINFKGLIQSDVISDLEEIAQNALSFIHQKFSILFSVSISNIHNSIDGIANAYKEAFEAMEYKIITGQGSIITYKKLVHTNNTCYEYHVETETQLVNYIKSGNFEYTKATLHNILKDNLSNKELTAKMAKCMIFDLISTIVKVSHELGDIYSKSLSGATQPLDILFSCETIEEMEHHLISILKNICSYVKENKKSHNYKLKCDIINEVETNYHDINLCVSSIADKFSLAPNYLSSFFKEQTGYKLSEYIAKARIEKAKELLKSEKENVGKIAKKVGFNDSNGFIRTFKKYEGITPGMYKQMQTALVQAEQSS